VITLIATKVTKNIKMIKIDASKIRVERALKNWTKTKLSEKADISRKTLMLIEGGKADKIKLSTIEKIATALGKNVEDFIEN
jgi:DNA-binding Xre family transcriptional regulator